ncbi:Adenylate kinase [Lishizhenia tianjinensis]|uniref:Adenylate kinase n=1 Tax=Lishizhenia tianjinensis TaxID=477690 RepID=A0A1I7BMJ3_9FLAO|nr:adenylate kinase [Lishizhenia tianjinensis]SFT88424.1 Adenylate kinase [Lishizhenia tianjinensis]
MQFLRQFSGLLRLQDKTFSTFINAARVQAAVKSVAQSINSHYKGEEVIFLAILDGAFMFAADLLKHVDLTCEISFVKVQSYEGTKSTENVETLLGLDVELEGKNVVILEDIVDTGRTIEKVKDIVGVAKCKSFEVATFLFKPDAFLFEDRPKFVGLEISNTFVVGYGLDYNEKGRNLDAIFQLNTVQKDMLNIVLFGPPGAGKGTQSERLITKYDLVHLSTGDIFRANIGGGTELGVLAKSYIDKGQLVPDAVTIDMLKSEVKKYPAAKGFIFDGFPRTNAQADALDEFLASLDMSISAMLALEVPEEELKTRLAKRAEVSGRADDADPAIIQNRINVYRNETEPVKEFYQKQDKFIAIDGLGSMDEISERLYTAIDKL